MSYKLVFVQKPTYLHAIVTGENSKETVAHYLDDIRRKCSERNCQRVLIEERLEGPRLGTLDVFQITTEGSRHALGKFEAIAYVDVNAEGDRMTFAETVALNRAIPVKVFPAVADAEQWLQGMEQDTDSTS